jgi:small subunit ribosomal protein S6e
LKLTNSPNKFKNPLSLSIPMVHKLNISNKGKAWKLELEDDRLNGKSIGNKIKGKDIKPELEGYELEITGGSDSAGFPMSKDIEGIGRKKELLTKGWGMHKKPKGLSKKKVPTPKGLRLRKTLRGNTISEHTVQINLKVTKEGSKKLSELFPEQNKSKTPKTKEETSKADAPKEKAPNTEDKPAEASAEKVAEEVKKEVKDTAGKIAEEVKEEKPKSE